MKENVTLVITMFNRMEMLRSILHSIAIQTIKPSRIIIADDGSEDDPGELLAEYARSLGIPFTHIRQDNTGFRAARSRNNGIRAADDGIVVFADQDVVFTRRYFETMVEHLRPGRFLVGQLLRLDEAQTQALTAEMVQSGDYSGLITDEQIARMGQQYRKDRTYEWLHRLHLRAIGPKLRSGIVGLYKSDLEKVNGFDEAYQGWGHEDDDLGWRLYAAGVRGKNAFKTEYSLHQYHPPHRVPGARVNKEYFDRKKAEACKGDFRCDSGLSNENDNYDDVVVEQYCV